MMRNLLIFVSFFCVLILANSCNKKDENKLLYDKAFVEPIKHSRNELFAYIVSNQIPGFSIAVSVDGETVWSEGLGYANLELKAPITRKTKYRIGTASKAITSLTYHLLNEQEAFGNDTLVSNYFDEFKNKAYEVSLKNLVQETSGIRKPTANESAYFYANTSIQKGLNVFLKDSLLYKKPEEYLFESDFNYNLLGAIFEKKFDKRFYEVIKEVVLDTLQMDNTFVDKALIITDGRATCYSRNLVSQRVNSIFRDHTPAAPSRGLLSTADDMLKLGNALLHSEYITDTIRPEYFKSIVLPSGYDASWANGWNTFIDREGNYLYSCKGDVIGGGAHLVVYPKEKIVISCLTNISHQHRDMPTFKLLDFFVKFQRGEKLVEEKPKPKRQRKKETKKVEETEDKE